MVIPDIVVVGGSAGGVEALSALFWDMPQNFDCIFCGAPRAAEQPELAAIDPGADSAAPCRASTRWREDQAGVDLRGTTGFSFDGLQGDREPEEWPQGAPRSTGH